MVAAWTCEACDPAHDLNFYFYFFLSNQSLEWFAAEGYAWCLISQAVDVASASMPVDVGPGSGLRGGGSSLHEACVSRRGVLA
jgi:hypothetical protein